MRYRATSLAPQLIDAQLAVLRTVAAMRDGGTAASVAQRHSETQRGAPVLLVRSYLDWLHARGLVVRRLVRLSDERTVLRYQVSPLGQRLLAGDRSALQAVNHKPPQPHADDAWQTRAWRAMRILGKAGVAEVQTLLHDAGAEEHVLALLRRRLTGYLRALHEVGYLALLPSPKSAPRYMLIEDTGLQAPSVVPVTGGPAVVLDHNTGEWRCAVPRTAGQPAQPSTAEAA